MIKYNEICVHRIQMHSHTGLVAGVQADVAVRVLLSLLDLAREFVTTRQPEKKNPAHQKKLESGIFTGCRAKKFIPCKV